MHVGPGPDADGVDRIVFQQFLPVIVNPGNVELLCHTMTRLEATIDHPKDRQSFDLAKARDVAVAHVPTCTDKTYANFFLSHEKPPYIDRRGNTNGITTLAPEQLYLQSTPAAPAISIGEEKQT